VSPDFLLNNLVATTDGLFKSYVLVLKNFDSLVSNCEDFSLGLMGRQYPALRATDCDHYSCSDTDFYGYGWTTIQTFNTAVRPNVLSDCLAFATEAAITGSNAEFLCNHILDQAYYCGGHPFEFCGRPGVCAPDQCAVLLRDPTASFGFQRA